MKYFFASVQSDVMKCAKCCGEYSIYHPRCPFCMEWTSFNHFFRETNIYQLLKEQWQPFMDTVIRKIEFE